MHAHIPEPQVCFPNRDVRISRVPRTSSSFTRASGSFTSEEVNLLDRITRYRFGNEPEVIVEWKAARRVLGQPRTVVTPPARGTGDVQQAA